MKNTILELLVEEKVLLRNINKIPDVDVKMAVESARTINNVVEDILQFYEGIQRFKYAQKELQNVIDFYENKDKTESPVFKALIKAKNMMAWMLVEYGKLKEELRNKEFEHIKEVQYYLEVINNFINFKEKKDD